MVTNTVKTLTLVAGLAGASVLVGSLLAGPTGLVLSSWRGAQR